MLGFRLKGYGLRGGCGRRVSYSRGLVAPFRFCNERYSLCIQNFRSEDRSPIVGGFIACLLVYISPVLRGCT